MNNFPVTIIAFSLELLTESPWGSKVTLQIPRALGPNCVCDVLRRKDEESELKVQEQTEEKQFLKGISNAADSVSIHRQSVIKIT